MRVGMGYDVHRLTEDRDLILGGVKIDWEKGLLGHSDADVLIHAVMDALLGAAALGDIGKHFPDTDPAYKGISSILLLEHVTKLLREHHYEIGNIDATIIAQKPKMAPHIPQMRANMAKAMGINESQLNIKATTEEKLGFAFLSFTNAVLESGIKIVLEETSLEKYMENADIVITGEGRLDGQTAMGKAPVGVARLAKKHNIPVTAFAGSVTKEAIACNQNGIDAFFPILRGVTTLEDAMKPENAKANMADTVEQVFRLLNIRRK